MQHPAQSLIDEEYATISSADDARRAVRQAIYDGADCIKIIVDPPQATLTADEVRTIVDEAHRNKRRVAAHAVGDEAARIAIDAGADSIEHGYELKEATLKQMVAKKTFLVPTEYPVDYYLTLFAHAPGFSDAEREKLNKRMSAFHDANRARLALAIKVGVRIAAGSDHYYEFPGMTRGEASLMPLRAYAEAGMTPLEILRAATSNAADLLYDEPKVGSLAAGMTADLIAVQGDPLAKPEALEHAVFVMARGEIAKSPGAAR
jgi:imidazolonepropionase-like amidohydrolase